MIRTHLTLIIRYFSLSLKWKDAALINLRAVRAHDKHSWKQITQAWSLERTHHGANRNDDFTENIVNSFAETCSKFLTHLIFTDKQHSFAVQRKAQHDLHSGMLKIMVNYKTTCGLHSICLPIRATRIHKEWMQFQSTAGRAIS